jgi:hypothetical protein
MGILIQSFNIEIKKNIEKILIINNIFYYSQNKNPNYYLI